MDARAASRPSCAARCSSTGPTRWRPGASCARFQDAPDRPPARRARAAHRGRGHRPDARRRRAHVGQLRRQAQHAQRRGLHRPARAQRERPRALHRALARPPGVDVDGVELELRDGEVVSARAEGGDEYLQRALATDDGARCLGEIGIGTNFGIDRARRARSSSTRRSAGPSTSRSGAPTRRPAARTRAPLHWDLICDLRAGGRLSADGEVVQEGGRFAVVPVRVISERTA